MVLLIQASKAGKSTPKNNISFPPEIRFCAKELFIWGASLLEKDFKSIQLKLWARDSRKNIKCTGWRRLWTSPVSGRLIPDEEGKEVSTITARLWWECHRNPNQRVPLHGNEQRRGSKKQQSWFHSRPSDAAGLRASETPAPSAGQRSGLWSVPRLRQALLAPDYPNSLKYTSNLNTSSPETKQNPPQNLFIFPTIKMIYTHSTW